MSKSKSDSDPSVVSLFDTQVSPLFPDGDYKNPEFVPSDLKEVVVPTDHPQRILLDGVYVAKRIEHGDVVLVLVGRFSGRIPKVPEKNDFSQPKFARSLAQSGLEAK